MSYADAWLKWFDVIERGAYTLNARMLELARIDEAVEVLDIGTGIGEPAITAAAHMHSYGQVIALDRDPQMINLARARAQARGVANIDFIVDDIDTIGLASASMDAILSRWSLMFVADLPAVLTDLVRVLRPGGYLVVSCWAQAEKVPALSLARRAVHNYFEWSGPPINDAFKLADSKALQLAFAKAGLTDITCEPVPVVYEFKSVADYIQNRLDLTGPLWDGMDSTPRRLKDGAYAAIEIAMQAHKTPSGTYRFENQAYCIAGRVAV